MPRITLSIPDDLKKRMDKLPHVKVGVCHKAGIREESGEVKTV